MKHDKYWAALFTGTVILLVISARAYEALLVLGIAGAVGAFRVYKGTLDRRAALLSVAASVVALATALVLKQLGKG